MVPVSFHMLTLQVTGISMQNVLIGEDLNGCAFVCGSLSFLDKMSCGLALYVLQSYQCKLHVEMFYQYSVRSWLCSAFPFSYVNVSLQFNILFDTVSFEAGTTAPKLMDNNSLSSYISVTRYGLGLVPAICSLIGVAVTYTMKLHTPYLKSLAEPLLE